MIERWVNEMGICRQMSNRKDKNYKIKAYSLSGKFMGYLKTDRHLKIRIEEKSKLGVDNGK